jgi:hypothetical protein
VRDTIARRSDVDKNSVKFEVEPGTGKYRNGTITFSALKGESIDLQKLCENIKETRLGKGTRSKVNYLEITAEGELVAADKDALLTVSGTAQQFTLDDDPKAKPEEGVKTPYQRLRETLAKGEKIASVTGRVQGWSGVWPEVLRELATEPAKDMDKPGRKKPTLLVVTDFQTVKK